MARVHDSYMSNINFDETVSIYKHATFSLRLKEKKQRKLFESFRKGKSNVLELLFFQIFMTVFMAISKWFAYVYFPSSLTIANLALGVFCPVLVGWALIGVHCIHNFLPTTAANKYFHIEWIPKFQSLWLVMTSFSYALSVVVICNGPPCDENHQGWFESWGCTFSDKPNDGMPRDMMITSMILPFLLSVLERGALWEYVCFAYCVVISMIVYCIVAYEHTNCIGAFAMLVPFLCLFMYENQRQRLVVFLSALSQEALIAENKVLADRAHEVEMRNMIGNVAHDLRTPLSGFVSGLEILHSVALDLQADANTCKAGVVVRTESAGDCCTTRTDTHIATIQKTIESMRDTNTFMLMTINRCVDYTKCVNGLPLIPRMQCVRLANVIQKTVDCVQNMQSRIAVEMFLNNKTPIAEHVSTDLQWLQENILCLLSNAVKYSTVGTVTLKVEMEEATKESAPPHTGTATDNLSFPNSPQTMRFSNGSSDRSRSGSFFGKSWTTCFSGKYSAAREGEETDLEMGLGASADRRHQFSSASQIAPHMETEMQTVAPHPPVLQRQYHESLQWLLRFEVEDHGMGVSDSMQRMLFSPFKQAQRRGGGTGLGLFILARRIEALGGTYGVQKRRDEQPGSLFWFTIPYNPQPEVAPSSTSVTDATIAPTTSCIPNTLHTAFTTNVSVVNRSICAEHQRLSHLAATNNSEISSMSLPRGSAAQKDHTACNSSLAHREPMPSLVNLVVPTNTPLPKLRILLVDDSITILKMCGAILKRAGHTVVAAENGAEALIKLSIPLAVVDARQSDPNIINHSATDESVFDVVLMDLQMPVMDGVEATRRIRLYESQSQSSGDKPQRRQMVLGVSACSDDLTIHSAFDAGIDGFIPKPLTLDALRKAFNECTCANTLNAV